MYLRILLKSRLQLQLRGMTHLSMYNIINKQTFLLLQRNLVEHVLHNLNGSNVMQLEGTMARIICKFLAPLQMRTKIVY